MSPRGPLLLRSWLPGVLVALALGAALAAPGFAAAANPLIGQWHLDDVGSGSTAADSSGRGNDLTIENQINSPIVPGFFGSAYQFANSLDLRRDGVALQAAQVTVMAWVKSTSPGVSTYIVAEGGDSGCNGASYALQTGATGVRFYAWAGPGASVTATAESSGIWDGNWHAIAGTYDGTSVHLYVDGAEVGSGAAGPVGGIDYGLSNQDFTVGRFPPQACSGFNYTGAIDEVRVYNEALNAAQINQLQTATGPNPPILGGGSTTTTTSSTTSAATSTVTTTSAAPPPRGAAPAIPSATLSAAPTTVGRDLVLNAAGSSPGSSYTFSLGSDGKTVATCPAADPVLNAIVLRPVSTAASVTVHTAAGLSATATTSFTVAAPSSLPALAVPKGFANPLHGPVAGGPIGQVAVAAVQCTPPGGAPSSTAKSPPARQVGPGDTAVTEADPSRCTTEVQIGIVSGLGCFSPVSAGNPLPPAEAALLCKYERTCGMLSQLKTSYEAIAATAGAAAHQSALGDSLANGEVLSDVIYQSNQPVRIDGVEIDPVNGGVIVLAAAGLSSTGFWKAHSAYLLSSDAVVKIAGLPVSLHVPDYGAAYTQAKGVANCAQGFEQTGDPGCLGQVNLSVPNLTTLPSVDGPIDLSVSPEDFGVELGEFSIPQNVAPLPFLPDLPLTGTVKVTLSSLDSASMTIHVALPGLLSDGNGHGLTGDTTLTLTNQHTLQLDSLHILVPSLAQIGLSRLKNLEFTYMRANELFDGKATIDLSDALNGVINAELAFEHGDFQHAHVDYTANQGGGYGPLGPGIFITYVGADLFVDPTRVVGAARVSIGPAVTATGCGGLGVDGTITLAFGTPWSIDSSGNVQVVCNNFGYNSQFHADGNGNVSFGFGLDYPIPGLGDAKGEVVGQVYSNFSDVFEAQLDGELVASFGVKECAGPFCGNFGFNASATGTISLGLAHGRLVGGAGVCAKLGITFPDPVGFQGFDVGAGTSDLPGAIATAGSQSIAAAIASKLQILADNCNLTPWRLLPAPAGFARAHAHAAQATPLTFNVAPRTKMQVIGLQGSGDAPQVTVTGPGGKKVQTLGEGIGISGDALIIRQPVSNQTLIEIPAAAAGPWTLTPMPGSAPISRVQTAIQLPDPMIKARVTGSGLRRVLHYSLHPQPGLSVAFREGVDRGAHQIGLASRPRGALAFTPAIGSGAPRTIIATITRNGQVETSQIVARYRPGSNRPGRASHIHVADTHAGWTISFRPGAFATEQLVTIRFVDGTQILLAALRGQRSVTVPPSVDSTRPVGIEVVALRGQVRGAPAIVTARAARRR